MTTPAPSRLRQPWLLHVPGPLAAALGDEVFRSIPQQPGVYFFYDVEERLLYIGQSGDLRARIGSYRFVNGERHSRRLARLVRRICRVVWKVCESASHAMALKRDLLREHKPPFNRAGVWEGPGWWFTLNVSETRWHSLLTREAPEESAGIGPLPASFRYVHPALMRLAWRMLHPGAEYWELPAGLAGAIIPPEQSWNLRNGAAADCAEALRRLICGESQDMLDAFPVSETAAESAPPREAFWLNDLDVLRTFALQRSRERGAVVRAQTAG